MRLACIDDLGVEEGFGDVQGRSDQTGDSAGRTSRHQVRGGAVTTLGVDDVRSVFVDHEVQRLKWNVHEQLGGIGAVEGAQTLRPQNSTSALGARLVRRLVDLHALFDHWTGGC